MIKYVQTPEKYMRFAYPGRPGISFFDDHDGIIRQLAKKATDTMISKKRGKEWSDYKNNSLIDYSIDPKTDIIALGAKRGEYITMHYRVTDSPVNSCVRHGGRLVSPEDFLFMMNYMKVDGYELEKIEHKEVIKIMEDFADIEISSVKMSTTYSNRKSSLKNVEWEELAFNVQDKLIIITNILYWLYVSGENRKISTILIEYTTKDIVNKLIKLFPEIQIIGSSNG